MKTSTRFKRNAGTLAAALTLMSGLASAGAAGGNGPRPQPAAEQAAAPEQNNCAQTIQAVLHTRDGAPPLLLSAAAGAVPDWRDADMDGPRSACRLVDNDVEDNQYVNYTDETAKLLDQINQWLEFDRRPPLTPEEEQLLLLRKRGVYLALDAGDRKLHAYLGTGADKTDLGAFSERRGLQEWDAGRARRVARLYDRADRHYQPGLENNGGGPAGAMAPVPEPSSYAMLLGGLGLLAALRHRRRAKTAGA
jgi:hypothetical protein